MLGRWAIITGLAIGFSGAAVAAENPRVALDLKTATQLAVTNNPGIAGAAASASEMKASVAKARSALYPTVSIQTNYGYIDKQTLFGDTPVLEHTTWDNRVQVQQVVYSGGQVQAGINQARHGHSALTHAAAAAKAEVLANVAAGYFRAMQAREAIQVAESSVKSLEASYDSAGKLHEAGVVTGSDVLRAKVALDSAKSAVIGARNSYNVALANLRTAIGLPSDSVLEIKDGRADADLGAIAKGGTAQRPEIAASESALKAAQAARQAAKAGSLPTAVLVGDFFNEPEGSQFPRRTDSVMAGVVVKMNVFDGGLTRAGIDQADAAIARAKSDLEGAKQAVALQLDTARLDLDSAGARLATTATQVQSAEESLRVLEAGYKEGITPLTDVLAAETALTQARASRISATYDVKIAQVNLIRAMGLTDALAE